MGMTKKVCILLFIVLGLAFFYQNHVLSQPSVSYAPVSIAPVQSDTYITFYDFVQVGNSLSRYAIVDRSGNVQIKTIHSASMPNVATAARMAKDSSNVVHFVLNEVHFLSATSDRVLYKNERTLTAQPEIVPFPYVGVAPLNGFASKSSDIAIFNDVPYVVSYGTIYNQGVLSGTQIMVSKRLPTGWTTPVVLFQSSNFMYPNPDIALEFDSTSGHLFYQVFTNPNCLGINCPRSIYELVFVPSTLAVTSNNLVTTLSGPRPELLIAQPVVSRHSSLAYLHYPNNALNPRTTNANFASSRNSWTPQTLATSSIPITDLSATSIDLTSDSNGVLDVVASEKNTQNLNAKVSVFTTRNNGATWSTNTLLTSSTNHYRDVLSGIRYISPNKDKELNIAYVEGNFGPTSPFDKLLLIRQSRTGGTNNILVYQNPLGFTINSWDLLTT